MPLLRQVVEHPAFAAGQLNTNFLEQHGLPAEPGLNFEQGALVAALHAWHGRRRRASYPAGVSPGFRLDGAAWSSDRYRSADQELELAWTADGEQGLRVRVGDAAEQRVRLLSLEGDRLCYELDGGFRRVRVADGATTYVHFGVGEAVVNRLPRFADPTAIQVEPGSCVAPTPGAVVQVHVAVGDTVEVGQPLITLEAMKMHHTVRAGEAGEVRAVLSEPGAVVEEGALLVRLG